MSIIPVWAKALIILAVISAAFGAGVVWEAERTQTKLIAAQETTRIRMQAESDAKIAALTQKMTAMADAAIKDARERAEAEATAAIEDERVLQEAIRNAPDREALSLGSVDALNAVVGGVPAQPAPARPGAGNVQPTGRSFNPFRRSAPSVP
jgi:hypothetical protein